MELKDFPGVFVRTRSSVELDAAHGQLHFDWLDLKKDAIRVEIRDPWPLDTKVGFSFTILDDPLPYRGIGRVVPDTEPWDESSGDPSVTLCRGACCPCTGRYMAIQFEQINKRRSKPLGAVTGGVSVASMLAADAARYVVGEFTGNIVSRELEDRLPGYRTPVLLLHGLFGTRGALNLLEERLKRDAFPVFSFRLGLINIKQIQKTAQQVADKIEGICAREDFETIDIVGHSMGGLIGLSYIKSFRGHERVRRFIAIGTPFWGSNWAYAGVVIGGALVPSMTQLLPGSSFLQQLREEPMPNGTKVTCIAAKDDVLVPLKSAVLPRACNILVPRGHAGLVTSHIIYPIVRDALS